jgi:hypothetical protein
MHGHEFRQFDILRHNGVDDTILYERLERFIVQMLQLATATQLEVRARWFGMVRAVNKPSAGVKAISRGSERHMPPVCGNAVTA